MHNFHFKGARQLFNFSFMSHFYRRERRLNKFRSLSLSPFNLPFSPPDFDALPPKSIFTETSRIYIYAAAPAFIDCAGRAYLSAIIFSRYGCRRHFPPLRYDIALHIYYRVSFTSEEISRRAILARCMPPYSMQRNYYLWIACYCCD